MVIQLSVLLLFLARTQSPQHCWEFANQSGDIPDACGTSSLIRNGK